VRLPEAAWNIAIAWHRDSGSMPVVQRFVGMVGTPRAAPRGPSTRRRQSNH
jgi:hypothetical protein